MSRCGRCAHIFVALEVDIPRSMLHLWLRQNQFRYGMKKLSGLPKEESRRIRSYLIRYARARKEQEAGKVVIVFMDESYIHAGYCSKKTWYLAPSSSSVAPNRVRGSEKGKRLIIIHAMSKDGMIEMPAAESSDNLEEKVFTAAVVTDKLSAEGFEPEDYHDTLDGPKFIAWLRNRLIPTFQKKYGKK